MLFKFDKKGQVEFIVILGLLAIAVVGIYYVFQSGLIEDVTIPESVKEEQKLVKDFVENVIRDGSINTIRTLETHGGYLTSEQMPDYAFFARQEVPYWQQCDNDIGPEKLTVTERLETGIKNHIISSLQGIEEVYGKATDFDINSVGVEANILDSKVDIKVNMPVKVHGYLIREPYTVTIPTKFGRILDFAADFAHEAATERFWETFTSASIEMSDLPRFGLLTQCGQVIFWDQSKIADRMDNVVRYTLVNTGLWRQTQVLQNNGLITYGIERVNENIYPDLDIKFKLHDGFSVEVLDPLIIMNIDPFIESPIFPVPPICVSAYEQNYSISYPVVISVFDPILDDYFYFSSMIYVDRMEHGDCQQIESLVSSCEEAECYATITVKDTGGTPLEGAYAHSGGCSINTSNIQGIIEGPVPCGTSRLSVFHTPEYEVFSEDINIINDYNRQITLHRKPNLTFHFVHGSNCYGYTGNEMIMLNLTSTERESRFVVTNNNPDFNLNECVENDGATDICRQCDDSMQNNINQQACMQCGIVRSGCIRDNGLIDEVSVNYIPEGEYRADIMITNPSRIALQSQNYPFIAIPIYTHTIIFNVPEQNSDINVYIPDSESIYDEAISRYDDKYDQQTSWPACEFRTCDCDEDCAKGLAFQEAMDYLDWLWGFSWGVC